MEQRVLVCGGRDYDDRRSLDMVLNAAHSANPIVCLIHGAARGADTLAADWALAHDVLCNAYPADWDRDGKAAGPIRNRRMLENGKPHIVIAFPGGRGTADMIKQATKAGVPVVRVGQRLIKTCSLAEYERGDAT
jgi:hypothetical protein